MVQLQTHHIIISLLHGSELWSDLFEGSESNYEQEDKLFKIFIPTDYCADSTLGS